MIPARGPQTVFQNKFFQGIAKTGTERPVGGTSGTERQDTERNSLWNGLERNPWNGIAPGTDRPSNLGTEQGLERTGTETRGTFQTERAEF